MTTANLTDRTAEELAALYREHRASPREATIATLERAHQLQPHLNAFSHLDDDVAMQQAAQSETRWLRGEQKSPLDGIPISIKDNIRVKGMPTRFGSRASASDPADADSPSVARLREAGAILFGKTCLPDYAHKITTDSPLTGVTHNPYNLNHTPGGSSGGSSGAIAARIGPLTLGTDGGGSIRIPAAFTGIFGLKPTFGRVPHFPRGPFALLSHIGPMARTARDAATMLSIIAHPDHRDWYALPYQHLDYEKLLRVRLDHIRIAASETLGLPGITLQHDVRDHLHNAIETFAKLGASIEWVDPPATARCNEIHGVLWSAFSALLARNLGEVENRLDPSLKALASAGARINGLDLLETLLARGELGREIGGFFESYDLVVCPVYPTAAPRLDEIDEVEPPMPKFTAWCNQVGLPAASVYSGTTAQGLPIGVQIVGRHCADALVIAASHAFEVVHGTAPAPALESITELAQPSP